MEQIYLVEIFIDQVSVYVRDDDENSNTDKNFIVKVKFGPKVQFIIKEGQLAEASRKEDIVGCDLEGHRKWSRTFRVGKSYLFPSYPDVLAVTLSKFPLEIEVWTDDEQEQEIFVGVGSMLWDTQFYVFLNESMDVCKMHEPLAIKQVTRLYQECCCKLAGEVSFILRLSALGTSIITEFQQLLDKDPNFFLFRTDKAPSMFECSRVDGENPNFVMAGSLYETATLEDPDVIAMANKKIEVCTELQSCGHAAPGTDRKCHYDPADPNKQTPKEYPIEKIRMGNIAGPCGNTNCPLAHKIKHYLRQLTVYQRETNGGQLPPKKDDGSSKKICGRCGCKDDRWHRDKCPENQAKPVCPGCGGVAQSGETCEDRIKNLHGTGVTPTASPKPSHINYMIGITRDPELMESLFGTNFVVGNCEVKYPDTTLIFPQTRKSCSCGQKATDDQDFASTSTRPTAAAGTMASMGPKRSCPNYEIYNANVQSDGKRAINNFCTDIPDDKDCRCNPPKPTPPCKTFDCECLTEACNIDARKQHRPYCPSFKHKANCPVTMMNDEEQNNEFEDEPEAEPLPYGLPPIQLGPCPVLGRPCTVPDGFARMYKTGAMPNLPPSYSEAGKVCCSKEFERIKKALKEYMKNQKADDYRCLNKFNVDTERRCCDKEQRLLALMGKSCCGAHKLSIQDHYNEKFIREAAEKKQG